MMASSPEIVMLKSPPGSNAASPNTPGGNQFPSSANVYQLERLSHSEVAELREAFIMLADTEAQSEITPASLQKQLVALGQQPRDESELAKLISAVDQIRNGTISFPEFVVLMAYRVDEAQVNEMIRAFKQYDRTNSGFVSRSQFCELFAGYGDKSDPDELDAMLLAADPQGTGKIDYAKWVRSMAGETGLHGTSNTPQSYASFSASATPPLSSL